MKKWLLHIMLISVLGILAASCNQIIDDPTSGDCEMDTEKVQITFTLSMKAAAPASRTWGTDYDPNNIGNEFENQIDLDNLQVLVFNETTFVEEVNILAYWKVAENIYEFRGELPEATISTTTDYKVMVFSNCPDVDDTTDLAALSFVFHGDDADTEYIPMWGVKTTKFTLERFQDLGQINVLRAMAKVEVNLGDALEGYTLEKVQLNANKYNVNGFCLPTGYTDATNTEGMGIEAVFNPKNSATTIPSGTFALEFEKIANTHYIYIPEYLTTLETDKPSMTVTLKDPNNNTKTYPLEFKYYSGTNEGTSYNIVRNHYYQYTITSVGKTLEFTADIYSWSSATKEVNIIVEDFHWLYVKDKVLYMNNVNTIKTAFDSSTDDLTYNITDVRVYNTTTAWNTSVNGGQSVSIAETQKGDITITSDIPNNFVGKEFKVTVSSAISGKSETIQVYQFPPLYIDAIMGKPLSNNDDGQNNNNMYVFQSLLPDYSSIPYPDDFAENPTIQGNTHNHTAKDEAIGKSHADYLRESSVMGYPLLDSNGYTIDSDENNRLISPSFMLASQHGTNTNGSYNTKKNFCATYSETTNNGVIYDDWRMPTLAEVYLIDVLQNINKCAVKAILEGQYYWSSDETEAVKFMDPRTGLNGSYSSNSAAVRCVRDIK